MVNTTRDSLAVANENFIVNVVNNSGDYASVTSNLLRERYIDSCFEREYLRYCKHYGKDKNNMLGKVQYVPTESWANVMCDLIKNTRVDAYDTNYQYIVHAFAVNEEGKFGIKQFKKCLMDIRDKAEKIGATVAIPNLSQDFMNWTNWTAVYRTINDVFADSSVEVKVYRLGEVNDG